RRIAILGDSSGSSFVARGVAFDDRFAAVVCDGGIWDMHERAFLMERLSLRNAGCEATNGGGLGRRFRCPVLITMGEQGWLETDHVTELFEQLRIDHPDISLKIFESSETAAAQGHRDNPTLANEFIFDWVADRLESVSVRPAAANLSYAHRDLQAGLLETILQLSELAGELNELAFAEFRKDEVVESLLLGGQACNVLIGLVRQRHLHNPCVIQRRLSAHEALLLKHFRLCRYEGRVNMEHL